MSDDDIERATESDMLSVKYYAKLNKQLSILENEKQKKEE